MLHRRGLIVGLASLIAAPAIVRADVLMPIKRILWTPTVTIYDGDYIERGVMTTLQQAMDFISDNIDLRSPITLQLSEGTFEGAYAPRIMTDLIIEGAAPGKSFIKSRASATV